MSDRTSVPSNQIVSWLVLALGSISLLLLAYMGNKISEKTDDIPVIRSTVQEQQQQIHGMQGQTSDVPLIKLQMEFITKQLEHINSTEDTTSHAVEESRNKIADHERRIQRLEGK